MINTPVSDVDVKDVPVKADENETKVDTTHLKVEKDEEVTIKDRAEINK